VSGSALVTGATGFLGKAIVENLVLAGRPVRALVRSDSAASNVVALGAEPVRGDLRDRASLEAACAGCEVVYHVAGVNAFCLPDPRPLLEVNVAGSRAVANAAAAVGVAKLIYTSSAVTMDDPDTGSARLQRRRFPSDYARSKVAAERSVLQVAERTGLAVVCVNAMLGPYWAMPTAFLSGAAAAPGIAFVNSVGNLGGFFGPYVIGKLKAETGGFRGGLLAAAAALVISGALALSVKMKKRDPSPI